MEVACHQDQAVMVRLEQCIDPNVFKWSIWNNEIKLLLSRAPG